MNKSFHTERLALQPVELSDSDFLMELVNTPEWVRFIGERNVRTKTAAEQYVLNVMRNPLVHYWVVRSIDTQLPMGVVTFLKKDYLDHWDIGFAFLSRFTGKGYAHEATQAILRAITKTGKHNSILAVVLKENLSSIKLLENLGFQFSREIGVEKEILQLYARSAHPPSLLQQGNEK